MKVNVFDSDFNGYLYKATCETEAIGISVENSMDDSREASLEMSFEIYAKLLAQYLDSNNNVDLYLIAYDSKIGKFNAIERHNGIWNGLKKKGIAFSNTSKEKEFYELGESFFIAYAKVIKKEISNLFILNNAIICFAEQEEINNLIHKDYNILGSISKIKDYLLDRNCLFVELLDLGYDGNSLFLYAKKDSDKLANVKTLSGKFISKL